MGNDSLKSASLPVAASVIPAVSLTGVTKEYRRSHLGFVKKSRGVEDISFDVRPGEVFGLLGLNGSGKTTTIKLLLGVLFPTRGRVQLFGRDAGDPEARRAVGYLPEAPYFARHLTAREVLRFHGRLAGYSADHLEARIAEVLETVRMTPHADRRLREYSKGMLQRTGLAQAMVADPPLLLLDEPLTGLDPMGLREMRAFVSSVNARGKTVLLSSHSLSEASQLCHRVGVLVKGRLARVAERREWEGSAASLEKIFVETVGDPDVG